VFLDEIGDMEPGVQARLLKVLEESRFRRVGGVRDLVVDVRLIAATHQDLDALMERGLFREDLFFRISTLQLRLPPLRERRDDIPMLARRLVERYTTELGRPTVTLSRAALERLQDYDWPGNVRELRSVLERAILTSDGSELAPADLRLGRTPERDVGDADEPLAVVEKRHIRRVLARQDGNVARAARSLGISQSSLYQRIQRYGIPR
jgi:DNA-binding NtrC family response regulator